MNILVTGSNGQLGSEIQAQASFYPDRHFLFLDLPDLDITNQEQVDTFCREKKIGVIINCAAYTAVDKAESDAEAAFLVNREGAAVLASCALKYNVLLVHISTDYVFNGEAFTPYRESYPASPLGVYGISKWEGEERIREIAPSYFIIRTSWLYSSHGANFLKTMLRLGAERESLNVVFDQIGSPTSASDLAGAILFLLDRTDSDNRYRHTYHYSNEGVCSWYDFAVSIMDIAGLGCMVRPVESSEYPQTARRPHFSVLNKSAIKRDWGIHIPYWRASLVREIEKIMKNAER